MKKKFVLILIFFIQLNISYAQFPFRFAFDTIRVEAWPGLHSFAYGRIDDQLIIIGGRRDGIHAKENGFERNTANDSIYVIDLLTMKAKSYALEFFDKDIFDALTSSNSEYIQQNNLLYWIGGYSESINGSYKTHGIIVEIDLQKLIKILPDQQPQSSCFRKIVDPYFGITGGQIEQIDDTYCLIGGHRFEGKYNNNSGKIIQQYTSKVYYFKLYSKLDSFYFIKLDSLQDDFNFHRRDFNTTVFPMRNGQQQIIINSGVFLMNEDRPYFNMAKLNRNGYEDITDTQQQFANYNCAKLGLIDRQENVMRYFFFGGMSEYYRDSIGEISRDGVVPFVSHISLLERDANDKFQEYLMKDTLPGFFGTNAEFTYKDHLQLKRDEYIDPNIFSANPIHLGWIFGGLWNPLKERNPWFKDKASQVVANPYFIKLSLVRTTKTDNLLPYHKNNFVIEWNENPMQQNLSFSMKGDEIQSLHYWIINVEGKLISNGDMQVNHKNTYEIPLNVVNGMYKLMLSVNKEYVLSSQFEIMHN